MAVVTAVRGKLDMDNLGFDRDATFTGTATDFRASYTTSDYTDFGGHFTYPGGQPTGNIESITNVVGDLITFTVTGVDADLQRVLGYIQADDVRGAEAYILRDDDSITGGKVGDKLYGFGGNDSIDGGKGGDVLIGGEGADKLTGGLGADTYKYLDAEDSGVGAKARDTIFGFSHAEGDKIDLKLVDANEHTAKNDTFTFVDHFSGHAGELLVKSTDAGFMVMGDTDGRGGADFTILVKSVDGPLTSNDFAL